MGSNFFLNIFLHKFIIQSSFPLTQFENLMLLNIGISILKMAINYFVAKDFHFGLVAKMIK